MTSATTSAAKATAIETAGIEIITPDKRTAKPRDLFWPWFAANISVFGISYAAFVYGFGIGLWQAIIVSVIGITLSFLACGVIAIAGKRGSVPTMITARASFGVKGQRVPGFFSYLISMGWETFLAILAVLATATIVAKLRGDNTDGAYVGTKLIALLIVAVLIIGASVAGYHLIMKLQSWLTWITGAVTLAYIVLTIGQIDLGAAATLPSGTLQGSIGALVMMLTGFGLGWVNIAADWSRYQRRDASSTAIVFWNTFGGAVGPILLLLYGLVLVGSNQDLMGGISDDPIGTLADLLPTWFLVPFLISAVLALVSGAVLGIYSSGLTLLSLGLKVKRPVAAAVDGTILTIGTIVVVFFAANFIDPFQSFLITLGVPIAAWAGIAMADILIRKKDFDEDALFDSNGRYGAWNWTSIALMIGGSIIGWGLVINNFGEAAPWNNWQGYLLGPLGLGGRDGAWAWANLGVLFSLLIGFFGYLLLQRGAVHRQESGQ